MLISVMLFVFTGIYCPVSNIISQLESEFACSFRRIGSLSPFTIDSPHIFEYTQIDLRVFNDLLVDTLASKSATFQIPSKLRGVFK